MDDLVISLADAGATAALGAALAPLLGGGDVVCLTGPLGAGKTTLARGLLNARAGVEEAPSPTFALVETYQAGELCIWHFDLYRLERAEDVWELGLEDALAEGASLIEWPERIAAYIPEEALLVRLDDAGNGRRARLRGGGSWPQRLSAAGIAAPKESPKRI